MCGGEIKMKKSGIILLALFMSLALMGCNSYSGYSGEHPELYTMAVNSLLWNKGVSTLSDKLCDPTVKIVEQDNYGRTLFQYTEKSFTSNLAFSGLLISQTSIDGYVYYYEDVSFVVKEKVSHSNVEVNFDLQEIEKLKEANDWNKPIDIEKCVGKEISSSKKEVAAEEKLNEIFSAYDGYYNHFTFFLTEDSYGRSIYYSSVLIKENDNYFEKYIVLLFNKDLSYSILEITSLYNYQTELKQFKETHHWNEG